MLSRQPRRRQGGAAVEFALVLPVLMALLLGIVDYGWVFFQQMNVLSAAREGARYGVTFDQGGTPTPADAATSRATSALAVYGINTSTITAAQAGSSPTETLEVSITVPFEPLVGFVPVPDTLTAQSTMMLELQD